MVLLIYPAGYSRITALFVELDMEFACKVVVAILFVKVVVFKTAVWFCVFVSNVESLKSVSIVFVQKLTKTGSLTPNDVSPVPENDT